MRVGSFQPNCRCSQGICSPCVTRTRSVSRNLGESAAKGGFSHSEHLPHSCWDVVACVLFPRAGIRPLAMCEAGTSASSSWPSRRRSGAMVIGRRIELGMVTHVRRSPMWSAPGRWRQSAAYHLGRDGPTLLAIGWRDGGLVCQRSPPWVTSNARLAIG